MFNKSLDILIFISSIFLSEFSHPKEGVMKKMVLIGWAVGFPYFMAPFSQVEVLMYVLYPILAGAIYQAYVSWKNPELANQQHSNEQKSHH
jgi:hypothetical protein